MTSQGWKRRRVIGEFGQQAMTDYGIENLAGPCQYEIPVMALGHPWWSDHMGEKNWVNRADFDAALAFARKHFRIKVGGGVIW